MDEDARGHYEKTYSAECTITAEVELYEMDIPQAVEYIESVLTDRFWGRA